MRTNISMTTNYHDQIEIASRVINIHYDVRNGNEVSGIQVRYGNDQETLSIDSNVDGQASISYSGIPTADLISILEATQTELSLIREGFKV